MIAPGRCIRGYRFDERTAEGPITETWRATDLRRGTPCDVRVLTSPTPRAAATFARCGTLQKLVAHPNRLLVSDVVFLDPEFLTPGGGASVDAMCPDGLPAIVTEPITGPSLAAWLRMRRRSIDEVLTVFEDVVRAVSAAHSAGIGHRSLDAGHVWMQNRRTGFVTKVDPALGPVLVELGASVTSGRLPPPPDAADDTQADVFMLGTLLYEMVSGRLPFVPDDLRRGPIPEVVPPTHPFDQVPPSVRDLIAQMMSPDPRARPRTPDEVLEILAPEADFLAPFTPSRHPTGGTVVPLPDRSDTDASTEPGSSSEATPQHPEPFRVASWRHPVAVASLVAAVLLTAGGLVWLGG